MRGGAVRIDRDVQGDERLVLLLRHHGGEVDH
jgi:hypothetical protein